MGENGCKWQHNGTFNWNDSVYTLLRIAYGMFWSKYITCNTRWINQSIMNRTSCKIPHDFSYSTIQHICICKLILVYHSFLLKRRRLNNMQSIFCMVRLCFIAITTFGKGTLCMYTQTFIICDCPPGSAPIMLAWKYEELISSNIRLVSLSTWRNSGLNTPMFLTGSDPYQM